MNTSGIELTQNMKIGNQYFVEKVYTCNHINVMLFQI